MVNYRLEVKEIRVIFVDNTMPDYVKFIDGILYAESGDVTLSQKITATVPTINVANYKPYSTLTKLEVTAMFENAIDPDYYVLIKGELETNINNIFTNQFPYVKPLPWI
jgi:hypothetical protein